MARRRSFDPLSQPGRIGLVRSPLPILEGLAQARALVRAIEDRRRFHPMRALRPAGATSRYSRMLVESAPGRGLIPAGRFSFAVPQKVAICVRRKTRREVLFAKRKTGKGSRSPRRRNRFSDIGCS